MIYEIRKVKHTIDYDVYDSKSYPLSDVIEFDCYGVYEWNESWGYDWIKDFETIEECENFIKELENE